MVPELPARASLAYSLVVQGLIDATVTVMTCQKAFNFQARKVGAAVGMHELNWLVRYDPSLRPHAWEMLLTQRVFAQH